jgi:hypothetical protein
MAQFNGAEVVSLWQRLVNATLRADDLPSQLFAFLGSGETELKLMGGKKISREDARVLLQDLFPTDIQVRGVCSQPMAVVAAAPHVHYDHWAEYFCNRVAKNLAIGWVVAINFRDGDSRNIPAVIGRHIHVNRPLESSAPGGMEFESDRARAVFEQYTQALRTASGRDALPLDLLIELHAHHRTPKLEVATAGIEKAQIEQLNESYSNERAKKRMLPELSIEPMHAVRLKAENTKRMGSMQSQISMRALHIEIPREARQSEEHRRLLAGTLIMVLRQHMQQLAAA